MFLFYETKNTKSDIFAISEARSEIEIKAGEYILIEKSRGDVKL